MEDLEQERSFMSTFQLVCSGDGARSSQEVILWYNVSLQINQIWKRVKLTNNIKTIYSQRNILTLFTTCYKFDTAFNSDCMLADKLNPKIISYYNDDFNKQQQLWDLYCFHLYSYPYIHISWKYHIHEHISCTHTHFTDTNNWCKYKAVSL